MGLVLELLLPQQPCHQRLRRLAVDLLDHLCRHQRPTEELVDQHLNVLARLDEVYHLLVLVVPVNLDLHQLRLLPREVQVTHPEGLDLLLVEGV